MDLNQLYFDHQVMLMKADGAGSGKEGRALAYDARALADRIASFQERMGAPAAATWKTRPVRPGAALCAALTARGLMA